MIHCCNLQSLWVSESVADDLLVGPRVTLKMQDQKKEDNIAGQENAGQNFRLR